MGSLGKARPRLRPRRSAWHFLLASAVLLLPCTRHWLHTPRANWPLGGSPAEAAADRGAHGEDLRERGTRSAGGFKALLVRAC